MTRCSSGSWVVAIGATVLLAATMAPVMRADAQPTSPVYLGEMPPPSRILAEIKGKDAEDTIERQMGAFQLMLKVVDDMAWGLEKRYLPLKATPDENRIMQVYGVAYAELWHQAKNNEAHTYDHDPQLENDVINRLLPDHLRQLYSNSDEKAAANSKAQFQKNYGIPSSSGSAPGSPAKSASAGDDFDKLCAAKGLDGMSCMMQSMMNGVTKMTAAAQGPPTPGLRMSGLYQSGKFSIRLAEGPTAWINCGKVFFLSHYAVLRGTDAIHVKVANGAAP